MYTWEIENKLKEYQYNLPSNIYLKICNTSPQISRIKYEAFCNDFHMWIKDRENEIIFKVHPIKD